MKALCDCWRKSDTCIACYMANLEGWNHALAMSKAMEDDLRFLESVNVWHLLNLQPNPHSHPPSHTYGYDGGLDIITPSTEHGYSTNPYHNPHPQYHHHHHGNPTLYLQENRYLSPPTSVVSSVADLNRQNSVRRLSSPATGYGTSLPYPDLLANTRELSPFSPPPHSHKPVANGKPFDEVKRTPPILKKDFINIECCNSKDERPSTVIKINALSLDSPNISKNEENILEGKKVTFSDETVFVERNMDSPFWKAFTERRRQRRIARQRKQLNAQIAGASYQPSLLDIFKSAWTSRSSPTKDNNGNCTKRKQSKGEVLMYDNSNQQPEKYTAHYVYTPQGNKRPNKFLQIITCQFRSRSASPK